MKQITEHHKQNKIFNINQTSYNYHIPSQNKHILSKSLHGRHNLPKITASPYLNKIIGQLFQQSQLFKIKRYTEHNNITTRSLIGVKQPCNKNNIQKFYKIFNQQKFLSTQQNEYQSNVFQNTKRHSSQIIKKNQQNIVNKQFLRNFQQKSALLLQFNSQQSQPNLNGKKNTKNEAKLKFKSCKKLPKQLINAKLYSQQKMQINKIRAIREQQKRMSKSILVKKYNKFDNIVMINN